MTMKPEFRAIAKALQPYISDAYSLLNAADAVMQTMTPPTAADLHAAANHDDLVAMAMRSDTVMGFMAENKKIDAIKHLRFVASCGLKEAKDAVEDYRITEEAAWRKVNANNTAHWMDTYSDDEPPF